MTDEPDEFDEPDEPDEHKSLLECIADEIVECIPEKHRTKENAYALGQFCGLIVGFLVGRQIGRWIFGERDEK
jgi:hypothetical protein